MTPLAWAVVAALGIGPSPEAKAIAYLGREVPAWSRENRCFSCHNNGDAARALYEARRRGWAVPEGWLAETSRWLAAPEGWDRNGGEGPFSDKRLARIQFTSAMAAALGSGALKDRAALGRAAGRLAEDQAADGSWPIEEGPGTLGSPATYGRALATLAARGALAASDGVRYREAIARADRWLGSRAVANTLDAAVDAMARPDLGKGTLAYLREAQGGDGGWGPYRAAPAEAFDTAIALIALARARPNAEVRGMIRRGRLALIAAQRADGGWEETTRPAGGESYAQRLSTTGWATLALLATGADAER